MEQEKNKRAREYDDIEAKIWFSFENNNKKAKRRDVCGTSFTKEKNEVEEKGCLAFGVFDFPWLKDGVIYKLEDCLIDFEDNFLSSLQDQDNTCFKVSSGIDFFEENDRLCEAPKASMEDLWLPFEVNRLELEAEDLDCICSSLLNN